jgi:osmotically-inducible protein OsmY
MAEIRLLPGSEWLSDRQLGRERSKMPMIFDVAMSQLIRERLQKDRRTSGLTVDVSCSDGSISLIGSVDTEEQRDTAVFLVEGLAGVRSVLDHIIVRRPIVR